MKICKLEEIADISIGANLRRYNGENNMKVILPGSFDKIKGIKDEELKNRSLSDKLNEKYITKKGDILIKSKAPHDALYVDEEGLVVGERIIIVRLKETDDSKKINNPEFIAHQLNSKYFQNQIKKVQSGDNKLVPVNKIKELEIKLPSLEIQDDCVFLLELHAKRIIKFNRLIEIESKIRDKLLNDLLEGD